MRFDLITALVVPILLLWGVPYSIKNFLDGARTLHEASLIRRNRLARRER